MVTLGAMGNVVTIYYGNGLEPMANLEGAFYTNKEPHSCFFSLYPCCPCPTHTNPENYNLFILVDSLSSMYN